MTNRADPDQSASSEANDLDLHSLQKAGYIRVQQDQGSDALDLCWTMTQTNWLRYWLQELDYYSIDLFIAFGSIMTLATFLYFQIDLQLRGMDIFSRLQLGHFFLLMQERKGEVWKSFTLANNGQQSFKCIQPTKGEWISAV